MADVEVEQVESVLAARLNRPERKNAIGGRDAAAAPATIDLHERGCGSSAISGAEAGPG